MSHGGVYDASIRPSSDRELPTTIQGDALKGWVAQVMEAVGMSGEDAAIMAHVLVESDLRGVDTHGVLKMPLYVKRAQEGGSNPRAQMKILRQSATTARIDAEGGYGQVLAWKAMGLAMEKAREHDTGVVSVFNSNTLTAERIYTLRAAEEGMIGFCLSNADPQMAPFGGTTKMIGTNPWSVAVPGLRFPVAIDMSSTTAPWTRLALAAMKGEPIPEGWALDPDGNPTTDPRAGMEGTLTPLGGHKGYALGMMNELLTGVLGGGRKANEIPNYGVYGENTGVSHFLMAINVEAFLPLEEFRARVDRYVRLLTESPKAPGAEAILVPGERSHGIYQERSRKGIPLHPSLAANLVALAEELKVPFPV